MTVQEFPHTITYSFFKRNGHPDGEPYVRYWRHPEDAWAEFRRVEKDYIDSEKSYPKYIDGKTMKMIEPNGEYTIVEIN